MTTASTTEINVQQAVPFFMVSDIDTSLRFYIDGLGFTKTIEWVDEGKLRWCWLELGGAAAGAFRPLAGGEPSRQRQRAELLQSAPYQSGRRRHPTILVLRVHGVGEPAAVPAAELDRFRESDRRAGRIGARSGLIPYACWSKPVRKADPLRCSESPSTNVVSSRALQRFAATEAASSFAAFACSMRSVAASTRATL